MRDYLAGLFRKKGPTADVEPEFDVEVDKKEPMTIKVAMEYIQRKMFESDGTSEGYAVVPKDARQQLLRSAMAGDKDAHLKVKDMLLAFLEEGEIEVQGYSRTEATEYIYSYIWGLGPVEKFYRDGSVDEIRVNGPDNIYIVRRGKSEKVDESFDGPSSIEQVIKRMIIDDVGLSLDRSCPRAESVRKDGSRLTATCYPVSSTWTFVLRKHGTFRMDLDNLIRAKTLDERTWRALNVLIKGRANILFSGNVGAGKTSLMRKLIEEINPALRLLVIGKDLELRLADHYPDKDIIELEEHSYVGASMKALFETALRESPDCIIIEEFRGAGEAMEAIRACTRGHFGSMASAHFNNAEEAIEGTAMMMLEEGLTLPLQLAKLRVARAFNIVVQMYGDSVSGVKKLIGVTEVFVDDNNNINYIPLIKWAPFGEDYMGGGEWRFVSEPSKKLKSHMLRTIDGADLEAVGWRPL